MKALQGITVFQGLVLGIAFQYSAMAAGEEDMGLPHLSFTSTFAITSLLVNFEFSVCLCASLYNSVDTCIDPGVPENGRRIGNDFLVGSSVSYECDAGYVLSGSITLNCLSSATWDNPRPTCDPSKFCCLCLFYLGDFYRTVLLLSSVCCALICSHYISELEQVS